MFKPMDIPLEESHLTIPSYVFGKKRISAIPVMTTNGIQDVYITQENTNGEIFLDFLFQCVLPILLPFDGQNPNSVIVMDNASKYTPPG